MPKAAIFVIDGFEEIEAVTTVDILRRGNVIVDLVSLGKTHTVTGSHQIVLSADLILEDLKPTDYDILIIPGGTLAFLEHKKFMDLIAERGANGQKLAAICAAPVVLGRLGLLKDRRAVCYPSMEEELTGAIIQTDKVVTDGQFTTSRGPSTAIDFALEILTILVSAETSTKVAKDLLL